MSTSPDPRQFALNPAHYGLPTRDDLVAMRIWDIHYHGLEGGDLRRHEETHVLRRADGHRARALARHRRFASATRWAAPSRPRRGRRSGGSSSSTPTGSRD